MSAASSIVTDNELVFARGIPFWHNNGKLFYYDPASGTSGAAGTISGDTAPSEGVQLGTYDKATGRCDLFAETELRSALQPRLATWWAALEPSERGKPITPVAKPSRARRTTTKSAKSSGSASSKE